MNSSGNEQDVLDILGNIEAVLDILSSVETVLGGAKKDRLSAATIIAAEILEVGVKFLDIAANAGLEKEALAVMERFSQRTMSATSFLLRETEGGDKLCVLLPRIHKSIFEGTLKDIINQES